MPGKKKKNKNKTPNPNSKIGQPPSNDVKCIDTKIQQLNHPLIYTQTFVPHEEYINLQNKNTEQEKKILILEGNADQLRETIRRNNEEIQILKKSNLEYEKRVNELIKENERLNEHIQMLEKKVNDQQVSIDILMKDRAEARKEKHIQLLGYLMQDLNSEYNLQNSMPATFNRRLNNMRNIRNNNAHYIKKEDSDDLKKCKTKLICDHIDSVDADIIRCAEQKYRCNDVTKEMTKHIRDQIEFDKIDATNLTEDEQCDIADLELDLSKY